jgi:large subunit ribosomal protein L1
MATKNIVKKTKLQKRVSKRHFQNLEAVAKETGGKLVSVKDAVELLLKLHNTKVKDTSFELHVKLNIDPTKSDQFVRGSVVLPNGTGKTVRVAAFVTANKENEAKESGADLIGGEELIAQIKESGKIDFDVAVAEPEIMKKLPVIAKQLGIAGVMPSPKTNTVGENIGEMIKLIKAGKVDFRNDKSANLHVMFGRSSFGVEKIVENATALLETIDKLKPDAVKKTFIKTVHLSTAMGPSVRIK